ncbi:MAG: putative lipoprotein [Labilithrix sp.]|nr:putative lipoprotein [Labilithrix sp.]
MTLCRHLALASLTALLACGGGGAPGSIEPPSPASLPSPTPAPAPTTTSTARPPEPTASAPSPLRVRFLGVGGFLVEHDDEAVLTAPLYTRPSMIEASTGIPIESDAALVAARLPAPALANVHTVLAGHAHYDHLLDVPAVMSLAPKATLFANVSARNLLAAFAPDRAAKCAGKPAQPAARTIARSRVVAVDDPAASTVDYTNCPGQKPAGAPLHGTWVNVPGSHVRVLAVCSEHPDQIGPVHYGAGDVTEEECTPPTNMNDWKEGRTVAYLIDFLDPKTDLPVYRVFYEDAPAESPIGHVPPSFLAEKRIDLALMCVGTYDHVDDASPAKALAALAPRYALGGHWEDFFGSLESAPTPIPFLDVGAWGTKARAALPDAGETQPLVRNGKTASYRAALPQPGDTFDLSRP